MKDVERRATVRLAGAMVVVVLIFAGFFALLNGQLVLGMGRVAGAGVLAAVLLLTLVVVARQARALGGWAQYRLFRKTLRQNSPLPAEADGATWRPQLELAAAMLEPIRVRILWTWFVVALMITQSLSEGHDNPMLLLVLTVLGVIIGLVIVRVAAVTTTSRRDGVHRLLSELDRRTGSRPA